MSAVEPFVTKADVRKAYERPKSLAKWLPWVDYSDGVFLLEDNLSVGVMFDIQPVAVEARGAEFIDKVDGDIQNILSNSIPLENPPYILSVYSFDQHSLSEAKNAHREFVRKHSKDPRYQEFSEAYLQEVENHLDNVTNPDGYFFDPVVTKSKWSGVTRKIRCCLYRRLNSPSDAGDLSPEDAIRNVLMSVRSAFEDAGFSIKTLGMADLYSWLFPWFNQSHEIAEDNPDTLLSKVPYPGDDQIPFGADLASMLFLTQPESDAKHGLWDFGHSYHKAITINNLRAVPVAGQMSAELQRGDKAFALIDNLPPDSIYHVSIVFQPKDEVEARISAVKENSKGDHSDARNSLRQATKALDAISEGDLLFPTVSSVLLKGKTRAELRQKMLQTESLLLSGGFTVVREKEEQLPLHQYIRSLPFNYEFSEDQHLPFSRLTFVSHLSKILCLYGRSRGTDTPGLPFFNRGAEPLNLDFLVDRITNAFGVILGPPGTGKSALLQFLLWYFVGVHNARVFILEKGGSFKLFGGFAEHYGLSVNQVTMSPSSEYAFSPFADAVTMARENRKEVARQETEEALALRDKEETEHLFELEDDDEGSSELKRDYLGEMELSARVMITGGEEKEEAALMRADRVLIRNAIKRAAVAKLKEIEQNPDLPEKYHTVLPQDVATELDRIAEDEQLIPESRKAASRMAMSMRLFCDGLAGKFFNTPGTAWEEADITILEFGILAQDGYEDQLALAFMSLMNRICYVVERDEYKDKPTIILGDEAHLFLPNPLLAVYFVKIIKMFRKLGTWPWLATQNLDDFSGDSNKMLSMFEWVVAMSCPKEEIENIAKFRDLSDEEKGLLRAARKCPGRFTEGVILSDQVKSLFRNVPPPLFLASAMTEKDEKVERRQLMEEHECDELEAVRMVAKKISEQRK